MPNNTQPSNPATSAIINQTSTPPVNFELINRYDHTPTNTTVEMIERFDSRVWVMQTRDNAESCELIYMIWGTENDIVIRDVIAERTPATYQTVPRTEYRITHLGGGVWEARVSYQKQTLPSPVVTFDTTGATVRRTHSLQTVGSYPAGAPDFQRGINVTSQGIEGVEITIPQFTFRETHYFASNDVDAAYRTTLMELTGTVNDDVFRGFARGEVLFLGATGSRNNDGVWELTYTFSVSRNVTNITVGNINGIDKEGWHYLWTFNEQQVNADRLITRTVAVKVERVYEYADFNDLDIPDPLA